MRRKNLFQKVMVAIMAATIVAAEMPVSVFASSVPAAETENDEENTQDETSTPSPTTTVSKQDKNEGVTTGWGDVALKQAIAAGKYIKDTAPTVTGFSYDAARSIIKWNSVGEGFSYKITRANGSSFTTSNNYYSGGYYDDEDYWYGGFQPGEKVQIKVSAIKSGCDSVDINGVTYYYYYDDAYKLHVANYGSESAYTVTIPSKVANSLGTLKIDDITNTGYEFKTTENAGKGTQVELWYSTRADFNNYKTAKQKKNYWTSLFSTSCNSDFSIDFSELIPGNTYYAKARTKVTVKKPVSEQVYNAFDGNKTYDWDYVNGQDIKIYYIYEEQYSNFTNTVKFKLPVSDVSASAEVEKNKITLNIQASNNNLKTGYEIARKSGKQYKVLAKITGNIYEDKNLQSDTKYSYRVRAYTYNSKTKKYTYGDSVFLSKTTWGSDIKVQAVQTGKNSAKLTWKKVPGADGYEIYAFDGASVGNTISNGEVNYYNKKELVKTIKKASTTSYKIKNLTAGEDYTFAVRAYKTTKAGKKSKKYFIDGTASISFTFDSLTNVKTKENAKGEQKVSWSPAYAADGIMVEKYDNAKGKYVTFKKLKKTASSITLKPEAVGKTTNYRIYTYKGDKKGHVYTYSVTGYLATPSNVKAKKTKDGKGVNVSWNKVAGADYYVVYRSTELGTYDSDTKTYKNIDSETMVPVYCFKEGDELANGFAPEYEYYYEIPYSSVTTWDEYQDADGNYLGEGNWNYGDTVYNYAAAKRYYYSRIEQLKKLIEEAKKNNNTADLTEYQKELAELNKQKEENPTEDEYNVKYTNNIVATSVTDTAVVKTNNAVGNLLVKDRWADAGTAKNTTVTSSRKGQETVFYEGPSAGVTYYYYVKAFKYNTSQYDKNYNGYDDAAMSVGYSKPAKVTMGSAVKTPKISSAKSTKAKAVTIKWKKVTGASKYEIYRATSKKGSYELVGTANAKATSYTDKKLKSGKTYYYKIRASKTTEAGADYFTTYSAVKSAKVK